jgi:hypothetical protein
MRTRSVRLMATAVTLGVAALTPMVATAGPDDPAYVASALADRAAAEKRGVDQDANPLYAQLMAPLIAQYAADQATGDVHEAVYVDPFLPGWSGTIRPASFVNRYGATLRGNFYVPRLPWRDPVTGRTRSHGLPGLVFLPGFGSDDTSYRGPLEQLADAGYVVLAIAPQGQGGSDVDPQPTSVYCDPDGTWRAPQENGLTEPGRCAGYDGNADVRFPTEAQLGDAVGPSPLAGTPADVAPLAALVVESEKGHLTGDWSGILDVIKRNYENFRTRFAFTAYDAAAWLASDANPMRDVMDTDRLGIVGHSAGADGSVVAGNGDPEHRFAAAVAWDTYGTPPASITPTVPTLMFQAEQQQALGPWLPRPDDRLWPSYGIADRFRSAGVDFGLLALRGSTHQEWSYIPYAANDPVAPLANSNGVAGQVAVHETVAWLDRALKPGAAARVAAGRLWQRVLDDSTDASSRGQGTFDPVTGRNIPYTSGSLDLGAVLSRIFASELQLDGRWCPQWQLGC